MVHRICSACLTSPQSSPCSNSMNNQRVVCHRASVVVGSAFLLCCAVPQDSVLLLPHPSHAVVGDNNCSSALLAGAMTSGSTWPGTLWVTLPPTCPRRLVRLFYNHLYSRSCTPLFMWCGIQNLKNLLCSSLNSATGTSNCVLMLSPYVNRSSSMCPS